MLSEVLLLLLLSKQLVLLNAATECSFGNLPAWLIIHWLFLSETVFFSHLHIVLSLLSFSVQLKIISWRDSDGGEVHMDQLP